MLACVTFGYVDACSAGREISEEEGVMPLIPSSMGGFCVICDGAWVAAGVVVLQSHRVKSLSWVEFSVKGPQIYMALSNGGQKDVASDVLRVVSVPDAFLFFINAEIYTGEFATSLAGLLEKLGKVPVESVEFHFQRGDFEKWVGMTLGDVELADRLRQIDRFERGEELRAAIKERIQKRLEDLDRAV